MNSIEIVNRRGKLVKLEQKAETANNEDCDNDSITNDGDGVDVAAVKHAAAAAAGDNDYHVMTNSKYVANIAFVKEAADRKTRSVLSNYCQFSLHADRIGRKYIKNQKYFQSL